MEMGRFAFGSLVSPFRSLWFCWLFCVESFETWRLDVLYTIFVAFFFSIASPRTWKHKLPHKRAVTWVFVSLTVVVSSILLPTSQSPVDSTLIINPVEPSMTPISVYEISPVAFVVVFSKNLALHRCVNPHVPSKMEPPALRREDGKRVDGSPGRKVTSSHGMRRARTNLHQVTPDSAQLHREKQQKS